MLVDVSGAHRNRITARFADGRVIRGYALDFTPNRDTFHVRPLDATGAHERVTVRVDDLKALFFVKDLSATSHTGRDLDPKEVRVPPSQRRVVVRFGDGEIVAGSTCGYSPDRQGFFLFPLNPTTNNVRVFIVRRWAETIRVLEPAEDLADVLRELTSAGPAGSAPGGPPHRDDGVPTS